MYYQAHGFGDAAIQAYEYAKVLGSNSKTSYLLGVAYATRGEYDRAIQEVAPIRGYSPSVWKQGYWNLDLGRFTEAETKFLQSITDDSTNVAAIVGLARTYLSQERPSEAIELLKDLLDRGGTHPYVLYLLGTANQQAGHAEIARELLAVTKSGQPKWNDPWLDEMRSHQRGFAAELGRAVRKIDEGDLQGAQRALKNIESKYPYTPDVQTNLATTQLQLGQLDESIQTLGAAIKKSPRYAPLHLTMAFALAQSGDPVRAMEYAKEALKLQPSMVMAASFIGKIALQQKDYLLARDSLYQAIELGDADPRTRELLAELYLRSGDWSSAIRHYSIVLQISPHSTGSLGGLIVAIASSGSEKEASELLGSALKKYPTDPNILRAKSAIENLGVRP